VVYCHKGKEFETGVGKMSLIVINSASERDINSKLAKSASIEGLKQHVDSPADLNYMRY